MINRQQIAAGRLAPGDFLPSTRQLAQQLEINSMTVSKAYSLLVRDGVVELARGQGMRVRAPEAGGDGRHFRRATRVVCFPMSANFGRRPSIGSHRPAERLVDQVSREKHEELVEP